MKTHQLWPLLTDTEREKIVCKLGRHTRRDGQCIVWTGQRNRKGYGAIDVRGNTHPAHAMAFLLAGGLLRPGFVCDHICRNRACVNPAHIRAVTHRTNTIENSESIPAMHARKTHCKHGHPLAGANLKVEYRTRSGVRLPVRVCVECRRRTQRMRWRRLYSKNPTLLTTP